MFYEKPFTNKFGQVINPGDKVVFATQSTGTVDFQEGVYRGVHEHTTSWGGYHGRPKTDHLIQRVSILCTSTYREKTYTHVTTLNNNYVARVA